MGASPADGATPCRRLAEALPDGVLLADERGRVLFVNAAGASLLGRATQDLVGAPVADLLPERLREACRSRTADAAAHGLGSAWRLVLAPALVGGRELPVQASVALLEDEGRRFFAAVLRPATPGARAGAPSDEEERAHSRLAFLAEASTLLASSLDYQTTLATVARLAVPQLADWCAVDILDEAGSLVRVAVTSAEPVQAPAHRELFPRAAGPAGGPGVAHVVKSGKPLLYLEVPDALLAECARDPAHLRRLRALEVGSAMIVPLLARGASLGAVTLLAAESRRRYGPTDLAFAEDLAQRAALAVDNARLYRASLEALRARDGAVAALEDHLRRQGAVAELGRRALVSSDQSALMDEALALTLQALGADRVEILELSGRGGAALRASVGSSAAATEPDDAGAGSQAAFALALAEPVTIPELAEEARFHASRRLLAGGFTSGVTVAIRGGPRAFGTLGAWSRARRAFGEDDARLLQAVAQVLGTAIEREAARVSLRQSEERFRALIENSSDAVALVGRDGAIRYASPSTARVLGYEASEVLGLRGTDLVHPEDRPLLRRALQGLRGKARASVSLEHRVRHKDGTWRWVESVSTNLLHETAVGAVVTNYRDITDRKRAEELIQRQAYHDPLTGLPNRLLFNDRAALAMARAHRAGHGFALLYLDLDRLKEVNDGHGHAAGDALLQAVGRRLLECVREEDTVARLGGDEFAVVLNEVSTARESVLVAHKLLAALGRPFDVLGQSLEVTASIGVALYPADGVEVEALLKNADNALYRAKEAGRNTYELCTPEMNQIALERQRLERGLRQALERGQFVLHYQPAFDLKLGRMTGVEALVRWQHPELGLLAPERFIPLAESTGLIVPLGEWILGEACRQARSWRRSRFPSLRVAVNISGIQFQQRNLAQMVARTVREAGTDPESLEVEITETVALRDERQAAALLRSLRELGVRVAIDDFGTGHSSLAVLHRLPVQSLKIDQSFVSRIGEGNGRGDGAGTLVAAIIGMAHTLELHVVAEGVETEAQLDFLKARGCDSVQGYLLGRPQPADTLGRAH